MFYTKNKQLQYPRRTILEDVLSRDGLPTEESFTPFVGLKHMIDEQLHKSSAYVTINDIVNSARDFDVNMAKPYDVGSDCEEEYAVNRTKWYKRLEDVDDVFIESYVNNVLVGFKLNKGGIREIEQSSGDMRYITNPDTEALTIETDFIEKEEGCDSSDLMEASNKLPYYLKQLHIGSCIMKGSLLSFIIARERIADTINRGNKSVNYSPRFYIAEGVYKMTQNGMISGKFTADDNKAPTLQELLKWINGAYPNDIYYKAYMGLVDCCATIGIDLKKEDPLRYTADYINKMTCTYLASNEEYLVTYGMADRKILNMLSVDKLFRIVKNNPNTSDYNIKAITNDMLADTIASNVRTFKYKYDYRWKDSPEDVNRFLAYIAKKFKVAIKRLQDYEDDWDLLRRDDGSYVMIPVGDLFVGAGNRGRVACLSCSGHLVLLEDIDSYVTVMHVNDVIEMWEGRCKHEWEKLDL